MDMPAAAGRVGGVVMVTCPFTGSRGAAAGGIGAEDDQIVDGWVYEDRDPGAKV
jgi:hypothetical protein